MVRVPFGVRVLAALAVFGGLFGALVGLGLAGVGGLSWLTGMVTVSRGARYWGGSAFWAGVAAVAVGVVWIIVGFGLAAARHWAWTLALIVSFAMGVPSLIALFQGQLLAIFGLVVPVIVIVYLLRADVRAAFRRRHAPNPTM
ncbi:MAG TPA: hypothetical protein VFQ38_23900 [Longimicrobiales bacterium]|nr:hypothetical protein [Longimicrobiales bacterium]